MDVAKQGGEVVDVWRWPWVNKDNKEVMKLICGQSWKTCFDESRSWEKEQSISPLLRTPPLKKRRKAIAFQGKNLYADFLHPDSVDDHFDVLDHWIYKDVYGGGFFDVSGSFKVFDCIEEPVGCDDGPLPVKIKDEF
ncbi:hypothetical protein Tco_1375657 [Tanacetum coccineum]